MTRRTRQGNSKKISRGDPPNYPGKHFIRSKKVIRDMIDLAKVSKSDTVLELGAGNGALTVILLQHAGKVLAVEYDAELVEALKQKTAQAAHVKVIRQDILKLRLPQESFVVVANIPYAITTPIMKLLLNHPGTGLRRGVLLVEKGAAKRFTARTVKDPYVAAWRMWFQIRYAATVPRTCFSPPPNVDSAVIAITRKSDPAVPVREALKFHGLAQYVLRNPKAPVEAALAGVFTPAQIKAVKQHMPNAREGLLSEALSDEQWGAIFEAMVKHVPSFRWPKARS